jgi:hypothetical protein
MLFDENASADKPSEYRSNYPQTYPAWVHDLIAHELDVVIERHLRRVDPSSVKDQETVKRRPK